jgi:hypothetical protein
MAEREYTRKLSEVDRLLNDHRVSLDPAKVWDLVAEVANCSALLANAGPGSNQARVTKISEPVLASSNRPPHPKPDPHPSPPPPIELPPHPEPMPVPENPLQEEVRRRTRRP